jgi:hypothetical protein
MACRNKEKKTLTGKEKLPMVRGFLFILHIFHSCPLALPFYLSQHLPSAYWLILRSSLQSAMSMVISPCASWFPVKIFMDSDKMNAAAAVENRNQEKQQCGKCKTKQNSSRKETKNLNPSLRCMME